ncbi:uncharacterized protein LOC129288302 [Prosopis cineraria]|uniref:uncharacterized protein LOC129288302 n=1 Tax=Prosopis cineraria TaxID=364024 RepID=UPI00240FB661|nr:uncharacterized protein LOC129288302 [Prosopis cineraria]
MQELNVTCEEIVFRRLTTLELESLPRLNSFSSSHQCFFKFPLLTRVVIRQCPRMKTFCERGTSTPMLRRVIKDGKDKEWCLESDLNGIIKKIYGIRLHSITLKHLVLSLYPELRDLWYNPVENKMFSNLKSLVVKNCDFLSRVLIPSNLLRALRILEEIQVRECDSLEAVFEFKTPNEGEMAEKEVIHLRKISISNLPKLQYIWKQGCQEIESFGDSKEVQAERCKMSKAPTDGGKREEDEVGIPCQRPLFSVAKVDLPNLEAIAMKDMQNLKAIWDPILSPNSMGSFKSLEVNNCEKLENIFPAYMRKGYTSLETLTVRSCNSVQEIFQLGDVSDLISEEEKTQLKEMTLLQLPQLKHIWSRDPQSSLQISSLQSICVGQCRVLEYLIPFSIALGLPKLERIIIKRAGNMKNIVSKKEGPSDSPARFEFKQLNSLKLWNLQDLEGFCTENHTLVCSSLKTLSVHNCMKLKLFKTQCQEGVSDNNLQVSMQPLLALEEMCNIEDAQATFLYWILQNITTLEWLVIRSNSSKVIFQDEIPGDEKGQKDIKAKIKKLTLNDLDELRHICKEGFQLNPILEALEYLHVSCCSNLKLLVPSSVTFNRLAYLQVQNCNGLNDVITASTARSLVKLTTLKIRACNSVEQIVAQEGGESTNKEIAFDSLEVLELESLPRLKMFCSSSCYLKLPLLEKLVIRQCARMKSFSASDTSAPLLQEILTDDQDEQWFCEGDLDGTVKNIFQHMVAFRSLERLELFQYPEFTEMSNPTSTYSIGEELEVTECDSLEAVFDIKEVDDKVVKVDRCQQLTNLFSVSLCQGLRQLEELNIESCDGVEEIVANEEGLEELTFDFPRLTLLRLIRLTKLIVFYPKRYTLECPSLKILNVYRCKELQIFSFGHLNSQQHGVGDLELQNQQAWFHIEKQRFKYVAVLLKHFFHLKKLGIAALKSPPK